jgi:hypothetical protein
MAQFLTVYIWFPLVILLVFLYFIARFFQRFSGQRTFSHGFLLAGATFGIALVRYASLGGIAHDVVADGLFSISGLIAGGVSMRLYWLMVIRQSGTP